MFVATLAIGFRPSPATWQVLLQETLGIPAGHVGVTDPVASNGNILVFSLQTLEDVARLKQATTREWRVLGIVELTTAAGRWTPSDASAAAPSDGGGGAAAQWLVPVIIAGCGVVLVAVLLLVILRLRGRGKRRSTAAEADSDERHSLPMSTAFASEVFDMDTLEERAAARRQRGKERLVGA